MNARCRFLLIAARINRQIPWYSKKKPVVEPVCPCIHGLTDGIYFVLDVVEEVADRPHHTVETSLKVVSATPNEKV